MKTQLLLIGVGAVFALASLPANGAAQWCWGCDAEAINPCVLQEGSGFDSCSQPEPDVCNLSGQCSGSSALIMPPPEAPDWLWGAPIPTLVMGEDTRPLSWEANPHVKEEVITIDSIEMVLLRRGCDGMVLAAQVPGSQRGLARSLVSSISLSGD